MVQAAHNPARPVADADDKPRNPAGPVVDNGVDDDKKDVSSDAQKKAESSSGQERGFDPVKLFSEGVAGAYKMVGDAAAEVSRAGLPNGSEILPANEVATKSKVEKAVRANDVSSAHEDLYMQMKGPFKQQTFEPGVHHNADKSSNKVNDKGQITEFTTAPTKDNPNGLTYKNIQYDAQGAVKSFETPWGTINSRVGAADANGYGRWESRDRQGNLRTYAGADSATWMGKSAIDEKGFHHIVASGPKLWNMYTRASDGSHIETHPRIENKVLKGFETATTVGDNTKLSTVSHFENGKIVRNASVDITEQNGERSSVELNAKKDGGKFVSPEERKKMEALKSMLEVDKNPMLNNLRSFSMRRSGNNLNFAADLERPVDTPPPNVRVTGLGPFGGASAVPISSRINDPSGTIVTHPENPGQVDIVNMRGFTGESQAYGPRGRPRGVHAGTTESMTLYSDRNGQGHLTARSDKATVNLTARNMRGGMFGEVLADPGKKHALTEGLAKIRDNLDSVEFRRDGKGNLEGSIDPRISEIPLNKKLDDPVSKVLGLEATNLYFNQGKLDFKIESTPAGKDFKFKQGDLEIGVGKNGRDVRRMSVSRVVTSKDADGRPHAEVEFYGMKERTKLF